MRNETLYSYPELFGVADNNGYGLKVFAFLKLTALPFTHQHVFDAAAAPRGQLPYIVDDGQVVGGSDTIVSHLSQKYRLTIDDGLTPAQRDMSHLVERMLDDLYWVMSYSRWQDERYWPAFCARLRLEHAGLTEAGLLKAKEFNAQRYYYQGIGGYTPASAYARGIADLRVLANLVPGAGFVHSTKPTIVDTQRSIVSLRTSISSRSTPFSGSSLLRMATSSSTAVQFTPPSIEPSLGHDLSCVSRLLRLTVLAPGKPRSAPIRRWLAGRWLKRLAARREPRHTERAPSAASGSTARRRQPTTARANTSSTGYNTANQPWCPRSDSNQHFREET